MIVILLISTTTVSALEEQNHFLPDQTPIAGKPITYTFTGLHQEDYYNEIQNAMPSTAETDTKAVLPYGIGFLGANTLFYNENRKYDMPPYKITRTAPYPGTFTARVYMDRYVTFNNQWLLFNKSYEDYSIVVKGTVVFNTNGGEKIIPNQYYNNNDKFGVLPSNPLKKGFKFKGWYTKKSGGEKISQNSPISFGYNATITVYAQWEKTVKLKYKLNGGKLKKKASKYKLVKYGGKYGKLPKPMRKAYHFRGWFIKNKEITSKSKVNTLRNHSLTAKWVKKGKGKTVTKKEYNKVKKGMSYSDVKAAIGGNGSLYKKWTDKHDSYSLYKWKGSSYKQNGAYAMIGFKRNKVVTKIAYRL